MKEKVLIYSDNKLIKTLLFRLLIDAGLDVVDAWNLEDVRLKMDLFDEQFILFICEVTEDNRLGLYRYIREMLDDPKRTKVSSLALIPNDSAEMVGGAQKAGVNDLLLLPQKKETLRSVLQEKLKHVYMGLKSKNLTANTTSSIDENGGPEAFDDAAARENLMRELKLANRGGHTVSLLMVRTQGLSPWQVEKLEKNLQDSLRDTDLVLRYDIRTFVIVCPFTQKTFLVEVERKIHATYENLFGSYTMERRFFMFGANFPDDERDLEKLLTLMENGIHDSILINSIKGPLKTLSKVEIDDIRKKLRVYRF